MKKIIVLYLLFNIFLVSACGEKNVDYITDDEQKIEESVTERVSVAERIMVNSASGSLSEIRVNADVYIPKKKDMAVIDVAELKFDDKNKESIIKLCLDSELGSFDTNYPTPGDYMRNKRNSFGFSVSDDGQNEEVIETTKNADEYAGYEFKVKPFDITENGFIGKKGGVSYHLVFSTTEDTLAGKTSAYSCDLDNMFRESRITYGYEDEREVCPIELRNCDSVFQSETDENVENTAGISEEVARTKAKEFLENIGLSQMECYSTTDILWTDDESNSVIYGYGFDFTLEYNEVPLTGRYYDGDYWHNIDANNPISNSKWLYSYENKLTYWLALNNNINVIGDQYLAIKNSLLNPAVSAHIVITDDGIIKAVIENPVTIEKIESDIFPIDYKNAYEAYENMLNTDTDSYMIYNSNNVFADCNSFELGYIRCKS